MICVGINDREKAWHDLYKVKISTGERTLLRTNTDRVSAWIFDWKDQLRLAFRTTQAGDSEILRVDADALKPIYSCNVFETCAPVRFHKDNQRIYVTTNKGDDVNFTHLSLLDPTTGKLEVAESDPLKRVDFGGAIISDTTHELIGTVYNDDKVTHSLETSRVRSRLQPHSQARSGLRHSDQLPNGG